MPFAHKNAAAEIRHQIGSLADRVPKPPSPQANPEAMGPPRMIPDKAPLPSVSRWYPVKPEKLERKDQANPKRPRAVKGFANDSPILTSTSALVKDKAGKACPSSWIKVAIGLNTHTPNHSAASQGSASAPAGNSTDDNDIVMVLRKGLAERMATPTMKFCL